MTELFEDDHPTAASFEDLVGEGKKYKTPEDAAKALIEKDRFITQIQTENSTFREELKARQSLEELADRLNKTPNGEPPLTPRSEPSSKQEEPAPTDINELIERALDTRSATERRKANLAIAKEKSRELFGGDYTATLRQIAQELGVSDKFLTDVAASSPTAYEKLITSVQAPDNNRPSAPPQSSFDTQKTLGTTTRKNQAYYSDLRRKDLNTYLSKRVQNEMYKEAMAQGSKFFE